MFRTYYGGVQMKGVEYETAEYRRSKRSREVSVHDGRELRGLFVRKGSGLPSFRQQAL